MTALETARLWLRPLELTDAQQTQILFPQWEIVRFLTNTVPWPYPPDGALTYYRNFVLPAINQGKSWHWTLRLKTNPDQLIGSIALMCSADENRGFWLGLPWQGQGLMSEACETVTDFWFNVLGFPVLRVPKAIPNVASRRISEKQGMRVIAKMERDYVGGRFPAELWEITAEEWNRRKVGQRNSVPQCIMKERPVHKIEAAFGVSCTPDSRWLTLAATKRLRDGS